MVIYVWYYEFTKYYKILIIKVQYLYLVDNLKG